MAATPHSLAGALDASQLDGVDPSSAVVSQTLTTTQVKTPNSSRLDSYILVIMSVILILLSVLLVTNLQSQRANYLLGITKALADPTDHAAALTYARSSDVAVIKMSALFLGFLLIFTGALYVLRNATTQFSLQASGAAYAGHLETSSPGLVVVALGVMLVATALLTEHDISYSSDPSAGEARPAETIQPGAATPIPMQPTLQTGEAMRKLWVVLPALAAALSVAPPGTMAQQPQFVVINAPAPGSDSCAFAQTRAILVQKLNALHGVAGGVPAIDFSAQMAVVATTADRTATPSAMGPAAANPLTLLMSFSRAGKTANSGLYVFAVDASYATKFNGCRVQYTAKAAKRGSQVTIK